MAKTLSKSASGSLAPWLGISLIVILFDQLTKIAVLKTFGYGVMHPITGFFNLTLVFNRGAAFGFLSAASGWQRWAFTALGIAATLVICYLLKRHGHQRLFSLSLALILGGALGNVIDRLMYGHVIDFLDFHLRGSHWPAFNLADSAITIGAVLLVYDELRRVRGTR
ncbi:MULTISPECIES: signal peptidase II [Burkholderia]|uniref:Lipoprotein signal peptidase n=1 Tax=Burkholderia plantarii TaxID=41899 RepID=A0A0B6S5H2_BURPL|nr:MULTISPECIES: signal peptidase II [Burkholderia]AJK47496.1 lipoprotein signal peptidase LspA [Burkholderia plantarii]ALK31688.1 signal peptidase II [Burkholderia plantarii]MBI0327533.1 lipoprotein signal peptidase [Burkholderia plantarii]WLE60428.1 lipoprotein signal peptidase [Burkholderia plantarii]GLZ18035.1 lipoprotein signal peptidase [Burkholderia plantarii]